VTGRMSASVLTTSLGVEVARAARAARRRERRAAGPTLVLGMERVHKSYRAGTRGCGAVVRVLDGASLYVGAGEIVGVAGGARVGKSTLLLCAAGIARPERGRVMWGEDGVTEETKPPRPLYIDLRGGMARREIEGVMASDAPIILLDHASSALLAELRATLASSRGAWAHGIRARAVGASRAAPAFQAPDEIHAGAPRASAILVTSRSRAELGRVASRVLVLRGGRLHGVESSSAAARATWGGENQRNRCAARANSSFPAALARA
jgi:hypothetical protein